MKTTKIGTQTIVDAKFFAKAKPANVHGDTVDGLFHLAVRRMDIEAKREEDLRSMPIDKLLDL